MIDWWGPILHEYYAGTEGNGFTIINSQDWLDHPRLGRHAPIFGQFTSSTRTASELPPASRRRLFRRRPGRSRYHNDPEKTQIAPISRDGWSTLGDVGYLDEDGYLYLTDRKAHMIISGGVNIYPQETENVLINHPEVLDVAVFGVPNEDFGEEVKAVVQPARSAAAPARRWRTELIAYCRERISRHQMPALGRFRATSCRAIADRQALQAPDSRPLLAGHGVRR